MSASLDSLFAGDRYLVADDGTHCYPILRRGGKGPFYNVVLEDGQRLVDAMSSDHSRPYQWLISPTAVTAVQTQSPDGRENERWALRDINALSAACPAELPADTFDGAHDPRQDMYVRKWDKTPGVITVHPTDGLSRMDGNVDENPEIDWEAAQPASLIYTSGFHHLLPGTTSALYIRLVARLKELHGQEQSWSRVGVRVPVHPTRTDTIKVTFVVSYSTPRWNTEHKTGANGRKLKATYQVEDKKRIVAEIPVGPWVKVAADSKAAAIVEMDRQIDEWVEWVSTYGNVVPCDTCSGTGSVHTPGVRPSVTC